MDTDRPAGMRLVAWTPADFGNRLNDVIEVYGQAMSYDVTLLSARRGYMAIARTPTGLPGGSHRRRPAGG